MTDCLTDRQPPLRERPGARPWAARTPARSAVVITAAVVAALLVGGPAAAVDTRASRAPIISNHAPASTSGTWADEFTGAKGSRPDARKWAYNTGGTGWGDQELQSYTTSPANAHLDGKGHLAIVARPASTGSCWYGTCRYTSARLLTLNRFTQEYGHFEARIKVPAGSGLWPAFWALDTNVNAPADPAYAESDIMEQVGNEPRTNYSSLHAVRPTTQKSSCVGYTLPGGAAYSDAFHIYSADWNPSSVTFSVDGHPTATRTKASYGSAWTFDQPMFLILNLAVGGIWPGTPPATTTFPATMLVDYVRVSTTPHPVTASPVLPSTRPGGCDTAS